MMGYYQYRLESRSYHMALLIASRGPSALAELLVLCSQHWHAAKLAKSVQQILRNFGSGPVWQYWLPWQRPLRNRKNWTGSRKFMQIPSIWWKDCENRSFLLHSKCIWILKYILSIPTEFCLDYWTLEPYSAAIPGAFWLHSCSIWSACPNVARILKIVNSGWFRFIPA